MSKDLLASILEFKSVPVEEVSATAGDVYVKLTRAKVSLEYIKVQAPNEVLKREGKYAFMKIHHDLETVREVSELFKSMK